MGWYGKFIVKQLKLGFHLKSIDEDNLYSYFGSLDKFFEEYGKLREDIDYVQEHSEENKNFSAKSTAKMFNVIGKIGYLPEVSNSVFLLYFLHKNKLEIEYYPEEKIDLSKLENKGWKIIE